ncbi:hypothetical protein BBF96_15765 [Anoxybacter fermentans]|uniref:Mini-ribonuclease 3 n=2 Tax=Anoxybacter fermentans TaxID=1323375 RepID=A0A3S9T2C5_9FIRM|nr:hypothetical protein BBF96_15765 [Anoxybacter fermentans]
MIHELLLTFLKTAEKSTNEEGQIQTVQIKSIPPGIMAYMGDGIFELVVRNFFIQQGIWDSKKLHLKVTEFVNAKAQARLLREIKDKLTDEEKTILRRGRNSNAGNVPRNTNVSDYRYSTAFEAVLGYLMLKGDYDRLQVLITLIEEYLHHQISGN